MNTLATSKTETIKSFIRDIPDFPKAGVLFRDITPLLKDPKAFEITIDGLKSLVKKSNPDYIVGIESRGFLFGPVLARELKTGFVPIRKKGKLPYQTEQIACELEYGEAILEIHKDAVQRGARVAIVDDLLATGGTAFAAGKLIEKLGGSVVCAAFVVELLFLKGREKLSSYTVHSLVQY
jgi:adenine phosphoribosyltransferase